MTFLRASRRSQRGMSLVELMVGVAIGLIIVAAATVMAASQLTENRKLLLDTQLQQDMRATMDIITRDLRRAGHDRNVLDTVWDPNQAAKAPQPNPYTGPVLLSPSHVRFKYSRQQAYSVDTVFEYYLDANGVIMSKSGASTAEPLTDGNVLKVTAFTIQRDPATPLVSYLTCPKLCTDGTENCWPSFQTYDYTITLTAEARTDNRVTREMTSKVRSRNDAPQLSPPATQLCPP